MHPIVVIEEPGAEPRRVEVSGAVEIGRECEGVELSDPAVSRRHLVLRLEDGGVVVEDLGSGNGTYVNGVRLVGSSALGPDDVVTFGDSRLSIVPTAARATVAPTGPRPTVTAPVPEPSVAAPPTPGRRAALDELEVLEVDGGAVRFRRGTRGEVAAKGVAADLKRAKKMLAGFGSEPWGVEPQVCLVDPFPDPADPESIVAEGSVVDGSKAEVWMVVTAESPPEPVVRPLVHLFGASLPAVDDIRPFFDGYGLHLAGAPEPDPGLREQPLPPLGSAEGELGSAMSLSFVRHLIERESEKEFVRFVSTAQPARLDDSANAVYGMGMAALEQRWLENLSSAGPGAKPQAFLRVAASYIRPHVRREAEMFVYMLASLAFTMAFPFVSRTLIDTAIPSGKFSEVAKLLVVLGVTFAISMLSGLRRSYLSAFVSASVVREIRRRMFVRLQRLSMGWFHRHQQGDVLSRFFSDVGELEEGISQVLREGFFEILSLGVSATVLMILNPFLGAIVLLGAPLVAVVYRGMSAGALKRSTAVQEQTGAMLTVTSENYDAQPVVKAFSLERHELGRFDRSADRLFRQQMKLQLFGGLFGLSVNGIVTMLRLVVLGLGSWLILDGQLSIGGLVAFLGVMGEVLSPVAALTGLGQQLQSSAGALVRVNEVLEEEPAITDPPDAPDLPPLARDIRFAGVGFSYTSERQILQDVDLRIAAGTRVAFVGPSGAGKSSILQLLMRFYDPDEGAVVFDGRDVRTATLASLRSQVGVVFQDTFLFDASIRENIRIGRLDATDADVEAAAKAAELHDFVAGLPRGYDTGVGEQGSRLSGGQRQRLSIARTLLRNPTVLLLDEATSALDPRTERLISGTLQRVSEGRTTIAVTHRLLSVVDYDQIFVVVDGRIVEHGTHAELVARQGVFADLWAEQTGGIVPAGAPFDAAAALGRVALFAQLDRAGLEDAARRLVADDMQAGARVAEGGGRLVIVRSGRARVLVPGVGGGLTTAAELGAGDAFGLSAILGQGRGTILEAVDEVRVLSLGDQDIAALAATHPTVAAALEGGAVAAAGPVGGTRLSRATMGPSLAAPGRAATTDTRRTTGALPRIN
jgi:ABC-type multidrug transport system fused ATPase/permease subunit